MSEPLWVPTPESLERAEITRYLRRLEERTGRRFDSYDELWQWSVDDLDGFWASVWDHFGLEAVSSYQAVLADDRMPGAIWFPGARLNFAERCLSAGADDDTALVLVGEGETGLNSPVEVTYGELRRQVAAVAATLRRLGVGPGDRVAGYLPNIAEATVALLATAAVGALWTVASPDFGTPACSPASTRPSRSCSSPPTATGSAASRTTAGRPWPSWSPACPRCGPCSPWTA